MIGAEIQKIAEEGIRALDGVPTAAAVREAFAAAGAAGGLLARGLATGAFSSDEELNAARERLSLLWVKAWEAKNARRRK